MKKQWSRILFGMLFLLTMMMVSVTAFAETKYPVWIGNVQITDSNKNNVTGNGTVRYEPATSSSKAVLYLNNALLKSVYNQENYELNSYVVAKQDLIIDVTGSNQIGPKSSTKTELVKLAGYGIRATDFYNYYYTITVRGSGSLSICDKAGGIVAKGITLNTAGTVSVAEYGQLGLACCLKTVINANQDPGITTIQKGTVKLDSYVSKGVYGKLQINGGTLDAYARGEEAQMYGVNRALDHVPTFGSTYYPAVILGSSPSEIQLYENPGKSDYLGSAYVRIIKRAKKNLGSLTLKTTKFVYNGMTQKPGVVVKNEAGDILTKGKDYTVSFNDGCKMVRSHKVTVTGIGQYTGSLSKSFVINPKKVAFSSKTGEKNAIYLKWKILNTECTGYEIQYSQKSSCSGGKICKVGKRTTGSVRIKQLKSKQKYYVRIRAYRYYGSKYYYSAWSSIGYVTTK